MYWLFGLAFAFAYIAGYFLFLVPILPLPLPWPHYLYGAGLAMALAMAAVLVRLMSEHRPRLAMLVVAGVVGLYIHNLAIQVRLDEYALCQSRFLEDIDALLAREGSTVSRTIRVVPEYDAPAHMAIRAVANRERYTLNGLALVTFEPAAGANDEPTSRGTISVRMTKACALVAPSADPVRKQ